jgi:hypothetical protein
MVNLSKIMLMCLFFSIVTEAFGQEKLNDAVDVWIKSSSKGILKQRVLATDPIAPGKFPELRTLKENDYFRMLGLKQPPILNTKMFYVVNDIKPQSVLEAAAILRMDFAFEFGAETIAITHLGSKRTISVPHTDDQEMLVARLRKGFGYDGYVVDTRQNLILARVSGSLLQKGSQAIVVDSNEPFLSTQSKIGAASLIEMIARKGDFGVFRVIIGKSGADIQPGSRVQFSTQ